MQEVDLFHAELVDDFIPDPRPGPMFVEPDRYFDEPEKPSQSAGLLRWGAAANQRQRSGLLKFARWMAEAPDAERRAIMVLVDRFQGRVPRGAVETAAAVAGVTRKTVQRAVKRFEGYFPGVISAERRVRGDHKEAELTKRIKQTHREIAMKERATR